jgi:hypothetical protein
MLILILVENCRSENNGKFAVPLYSQRASELLRILTSIATLWLACCAYNLFRVYLRWITRTAHGAVWPATP